MKNPNRVKNIPNEARMRGLEEARRRRAEKAEARRTEIARRWGNGETKTQIAKALRVNFETVNRAIKQITTAADKQSDAETAIVEAVLAIGKAVGRAEKTEAEARTAILAIIQRQSRETE